MARSGLRPVLRNALQSKHVRRLQFSGSCPGLEAHHRRASDETDLSATEHDARLQAVFESAPAAHREWLTEKLRYSNEISLRRRLKRLFAQFSFLLDGLIPDRKATINAIYDNRNY